MGTIKEKYHDKGQREVEVRDNDVAEADPDYMKQIHSRPLHAGVN